MARPQSIGKLGSKLFQPAYVLTSEATNIPVITNTSNIKIRMFGESLLQNRRSLIQFKYQDTGWCLIGISTSNFNGVLTGTIVVSNIKQDYTNVSPLPTGRGLSSWVRYHRDQVISDYIDLDVTLKAGLFSVPSIYTSYDDVIIKNINGDDISQDEGSSRSGNNELEGSIFYQRCIFCGNIGNTSVQPLVSQLSNINKVLI